MGEMLTALLFAVAAPPVLVRLPVGGIVPDVAQEGRTTFVAYGDRSDGFFATLDEETDSLSAPVRVNSQRGTVAAGGERGPKIATGSGIVHVAWQDPKPNPPRVWYARSANGGKEFASQRNLLTGPAGIDMVNVAARGRNVVVFWLDGRGGEDQDNPVSSRIYFVESTDGGNTFGPNTRLPTPFRGLACACCTFDPQFGEDGALTIVFRTGFRNVRDVWMLRRAPGESSFAATRVSDDRWVLPTCPMDGPRLVTGAGKPLVVWMSDQRTYWSELAGDAFQPRSALSDAVGKFPVAARSAAGETIAAWDSNRTLRWRFLPEGPTGEFASSGHRSAIAPGADGRFRILN